MVSNADVRAALQCIQRALRPGGILIFDIFDAAQIFKDFRKAAREVVRVGEKTITRDSTRSFNLKTGWTWNWNCVYTVKDGGPRRTYRDQTVLRAFTRDEMRLFLALAGFTMVHCRLRDATFLVVAAQSRASMNSDRLPR